MRRFALFIGINSYASSPLSCARADAEALHREFASRYDVTRLLVDRQATCERIAQEVELVRRMARSGDMFVFFFSGHGSDRGSERLLAIPGRDSRGRPRRSESFSTETLRRKTDIKGLHRLFILDCCRVRDDGDDDDIPEWARSTAKAPAFVLRHGGRSVIRPTLLSSSSPGQHAYENLSRGHGYFTDAFLKAIRDPDVHDFNQFRDRLDAVMSGQDKPADQDPYFEGPIGSDLPIWPDWEGESPAATPPPVPPRKRKRRRHPPPPPSTDSGASGEAFVAMVSDLLADPPDPDEPDTPDERTDIVQSPEAGMWVPAPGHAWADTHDTAARPAARLAEAVWTAGLPFGTNNPHVLSTRTRGVWVPAPGYVWQWTDNDIPRITARVTPASWKPARPVKGHEHVYAGLTEGTWIPEPGWGFIATPPGDFRVRWVSGSPCHPRYPHVVAAGQTGYWVPAPGYIWYFSGSDNPLPFGDFKRFSNPARLRVPPRDVPRRSLRSFPAIGKIFSNHWKIWDVFSNHWKKIFQ